jgi:hypothetical protein
MLRRIGAVLLPGIGTVWTDPEHRSVSIPEGQAALHCVGLAAVRRAAIGAEVTPF